MKRATESSALQKHFLEYRSFHRDPANHLLHGIGIPLIMIGVLGLTCRLGAWPIASVLSLNLGWVLWAAYSAFAAKLSFRLAAGFNLMTLAFYFLGQALNPAICAAAFVFGWGFQLVGHRVYEKKNPAFLTHLRYLAVGPLWVYSRLFHLTID